MKVVVVCPTYGRIPYLNRMVASFLQQQYSKKHLIIVNDDSNVKVAFDHPLVTIINLDKKILLPQKRNLANASMYCDLLMPFDDDDIFLPNRIDNHVKIHRDNPQIDYYHNSASYIVYGDSFELGGCSPNASSYTQQGWYKVGGYTSATNYGDDTEFIGKIDRNVKLQVNNPSQLDYVYNFGGIEYHTSCHSDPSIEQRAIMQLERLGLVGKTFHIEPNLKQFNTFLDLQAQFDQTKKPIKLVHQSPGVIKIIP